MTDKGKPVYLLIDKHRMCVVHRHENNVALRHLMHIEMAHCPAAIFEEEHDANWLEFSHTELMLLYEGMVQTKYTGHATTPLIFLLKRLARTVEPSKVDAFEANLQANAIAFEDKNFYQYVYGNNRAKEMDDVFEGAARRGSLTQALALPPSTPAKPPSSPVMGTQPWQPIAPAAPVKYPPPWA